MNGRGRVTRLVLSTLAVAAASAFLMSGCSDAIFPAVHDMPAQRTETTLTPDEVKQVTNNLVNQRDQLSTEAQTVEQQGTATVAADNAASAAPANSAAPAPAAASGATPSAGAGAKP